MTSKVPYPCPKCGKALYYSEGFPGFFNCSCGYMRFDGKQEEAHEQMEGKQ